MFRWKNVYLAGGLFPVRVESRLLATGRLRVRLGFPRGHDLEVKNTPALDWSAPERHQTLIAARTPNRVDFERRIDDTNYFASVSWQGAAQLKEVAVHQFRLQADSAADRLAFTVAFSQAAHKARAPSVDETLTASTSHWARFWKRGAEIDFSGSRDPRASVLEGRVILSQYLTAIPGRHPL